MFLAKIANSADIGLNSSATPGAITTTQSSAFTVTVTNNGPEAAINLVVTAAATPSLSLTSCSSDQGGVCSGGAASRSVTFATLANGATATINLNGTLDDILTGGPNYGISASFTSTSVDTNNTNDATTATFSALSCYCASF